MKNFIEVKKGLTEARFNVHYINVLHIVDFYEWGGCTQIVLNNNRTIDVIDTVQEILEKINNLK